MEKEITRLWQQVRRKYSFVTGVSSGMAAPSEIYKHYDFEIYFRDPQEDMRSDWERIGDDMRGVIAHEHARAAGRTR